MLWEPEGGDPRDLTPDAAAAVAEAVNDAGIVVGIEMLPDAPGIPFTAALWDLDGSAIRLEHPGAGSYGYGINGRGDVVGYVVHTTADAVHAARAAVWPCV